MTPSQILEPHRHVSHDVRANIAATLARHYAELSGLDDAENRSFSLSRFLRSHAERLPLPERERQICEGAATIAGQQFLPHRCWVPLGAIATRAMATTPGSKGGVLVNCAPGAELGRAMATTPGSKGGYAIGGEVIDPADVLRPWSVTVSAGAQVFPNLQGNVTIPRVTTAVTATWIGENATAPAETPPTLGAASLMPKTAIALVKFSMQLLKQGEAVEAFLRSQLLAGIGELIDIAFLNGAGGVQPLGLLATSGIGTQSGTSLAHAGILSMKQKCLTAGAREDGLAWIGTPAIEELLGARERASGGGRFLWDDGAILGRPANATKNAPASALIVGDFSSAVLGIFGPGIRIDIDPSQDFNSAGLVARVLLLCDVAFPQPAAFTVATSIT